MSFWANCLWYNLFNTFEDWKNNWVKEMREEPDEELVREAKLYFSKEAKHVTNENQCKT